ncbi:MAG: alpha/beta fold hydrolase [Lachnospiraceae bacterium]|jgi:lysophospholipase
MEDIPDKIQPVSEENYAETMNNVIEPELRAHEKELYLERVPGKKIHVELFVPAHAGAVMVISHGYTESSLKFHELAWYFYKRDYAVFIPDQAGHGKSYRLVSDPCLVHMDHWQTYIDDFNNVIDTARKQFPKLPLFVYGHSMGGAIAAASASERADTVRKAVLSSPMIRPVTGDMPVWAAKLLGWGMKRRGRYEAPLPGYHAFDGTYTFEESNTQCRARFDYYKDLQMRHKEIQTDGGTYGWVAEGLKMGDYLLKKAPGRLTMPVLLLQAELDRTVSLPAQNTFISKVPDGKLISYPAKHEIYREKNSILEKYLNDLFAFLES